MDDEAARGLLQDVPCYRNDDDIELGVKKRWYNISDDTMVELKKQVGLAGPLVLVSLLQYSLQTISVMFVGHLGEVCLSGASMATSFAGVTGFSLMVTCETSLLSLRKLVTHDISCFAICKYLNNGSTNIY